MKTAKLHFCDNNGHEMKEVDFSVAGKHYVCPMCQLIIKDGKKVKGVITIKRKEKYVKNL